MHIPESRGRVSLLAWRQRPERRPLPRTHHHSFHTHLLAENSLS